MTDSRKRFNSPKIYPSDMNLDAIIDFEDVTRPTEILEKSLTEFWPAIQRSSSIRVNSRVFLDSSRDNITASILITGITDKQSRVYKDKFGFATGQHKIAYGDESPDMDAQDAGTERTGIPVRTGTVNRRGSKVREIAVANDPGFLQIMTNLWTEEEQEKHNPMAAVLKSDRDAMEGNEKSRHEKSGEPLASSSQDSEIAISELELESNELGIFDNSIEKSLREENEELRKLLGDAEAARNDMELAKTELQQKLDIAAEVLKSLQQQVASNKPAGQNDPIMDPSVTGIAGSSVPAVADADVITHANTSTSTSVSASEPMKSPISGPPNPIGPTSLAGERDDSGRLVGLVLTLQHSLAEELSRNSVLAASAAELKRQLDGSQKQLTSLRREQEMRLMLKSSNGAADGLLGREGATGVTLSTRGSDRQTPAAAGATSTAATAPPTKQDVSTATVIENASGIQSQLEIQLGVALDAMGHLQELVALLIAGVATSQETVQVTAVQNQRTLLRLTEITGIIASNESKHQVSELADKTSTGSNRAGSAAVGVGVGAAGAAGAAGVGAGTQGSAMRGAGSSLLTAKLGAGSRDVSATRSAQTNHASTARDSRQRVGGSTGGSGCGGGGGGGGGRPAVGPNGGVQDEISAVLSALGLASVTAEAVTDEQPETWEVKYAKESADEKSYRIAQAANPQRKHADHQQQQRPSPNKVQLEPREQPKSQDKAAAPQGATPSPAAAVRSPTQIPKYYSCEEYEASSPSGSGSDNISGSTGSKQAGVSGSPFLRVEQAPGRVTAQENKSRQVGGTPPPPSLSSASSDSIRIALQEKRIESAQLTVIDEEVGFFLSDASPPVSDQGTTQNSDAGSRRRNYDEGDSSAALTEGSPVGPASTGRLGDSSSPTSIVISPTQQKLIESSRQKRSLETTIAAVEAVESQLRTPVAVVAVSFAPGTKEEFSDRLATVVTTPTHTTEQEQQRPTTANLQDATPKTPVEPSVTSTSTPVGPTSLHKNSPSALGRSPSQQQQQQQPQQQQQRGSPNRSSPLFKPSSSSSSSSSPPNKTKAQPALAAGWIPGYPGAINPGNRYQPQHLTPTPVSATPSKFYSPTKFSTASVFADRSPVKKSPAARGSDGQVSRQLLYSLKQLVDNISPEIRMAVLGDITPSATDNSIWGETMRCADYVARQVFERSGALSLGLWGCSVKWLTPQQAWAVQAEVVEEAASGLTTAQPAMGKDMRACLEETLRRLPEVTDICVICHTLTYPFEPLSTDRTTHAVTNWQAFLRRHPGKRFHFIAVGGGPANRKHLKCMAAEGGGMFVVFDKTTPV